MFFLSLFPWGSLLGFFYKYFLGSFFRSHYSTMQLEAAGRRLCFAGRGFVCMASELVRSRSGFLVALLS